MGCYSWMFADTNNRHNLVMGECGYLMCPDGTYIEEPCYDGYGRFDGVDVYDKVVEWHREYFANHPNHWLPYRQCEVQEFWWYPIVTDLFIPFEDLSKALKKYADGFSEEEKQARRIWCPGEIRSIGIDIACCDEDNASLPYPIKITKRHAMPYASLPPSEKDPTQGGINVW